MYSFYIHVLYFAIGIVFKLSAPLRWCLDGKTKRLRFPLAKKEKINIKHHLFIYDFIVPLFRVPDICFFSTSFSFGEPRALWLQHVLVRLVNIFVYYTHICIVYKLIFVSKLGVRIRETNFSARPRPSIRAWKRRSHSEIEMRNTQFYAHSTFQPVPAKSLFVHISSSSIYTTNVGHTTDAMF